jgi:glycosyltransferase involved in cell wall biosynthesis
MKIAWVSFGFGEYSVRQANALAIEHEVLLILVLNGVDRVTGRVHPAIRFLGIERPRLREPVRQLGLIGRILLKIRDFHPDVVHYQNGHLWFNLFLPMLRRFPLVVTTHDPRHHYGDSESQKTPQWLMDFGVRRAIRVIVHGRALTNEVSEEIGIPPDCIHVVPHVAIGDLEGVHRVPEDDNVVLFFGRIWQYKGLEYLIKAEPAVSKEIPGVCIVIAGRGEDFERYRRMMKDPAAFEIHNSWVSDEQRSELFQRAAVVVLPYTSATQSGVIPVAYSYAKPVVATTVGAIPEYVEHGRTGLLVPPRDERALAEAIVALLRDPAARRQMGANGQRKLTDEWAPDVVARKTCEVYRLAIRDHMTVVNRSTPRSPQ